MSHTVELELLLICAAIYFVVFSFVSMWVYKHKHNRIVLWQYPRFFKFLEVVDTITSMRSTKKLFEPKYRIFSMTYFAQGVVFGITGLAFPIYLQRQFNLTMSELASMTILMQFPWFVKPLWGFVSDNVPIFGRRRMPYIVICSFMVSLCAVAIGSVVNTYWMFVIAAFCLNLGFGFTDVACDAHGVDQCKNDEKEEGIIQAISWETRCIGACLSGFGGGYLMKMCGERFSFLMMAFIPVILCVIAYKSMNEENKKNYPPINWACIWNDTLTASSKFSVAYLFLLMKFSIPAVVVYFATRHFAPDNGVLCQAKELIVNNYANVCIVGVPVVFLGIFLISFFSHCMKASENGLFKKSSYEGVVKFLVAAAIFLFILNMAPVFSPSAMQFYMGTILGYSPLARGILGALGSFGGFLGLRYFREYLCNPDKKIDVDIRMIFTICLLFVAVTGISYIWAVYYFTALLFLSLTGAFVSMIGFVSSMRVAVRACPRGIEGTIFALMMSVCNVGSMAGTWIGGKVFDRFGEIGSVAGKVVYANPGNGFLWMVIISTVMGLVPLLFLPLLKDFRQGNVK